MLHQTYRTPFIRDAVSQAPARLSGLCKGGSFFKLGPQRINWLAFVLALFIAPFIPVLVLLPLALLGGAGLLFPAVPGFAIYFGGIPYLVIGVPLLVWGLSHWGPNAGRLSSLAAQSIVVLAPVALVITALIDLDAVMPMVFFGVCSLIFAMLWAGLFTWCYARLVGLFARWM